jgi:NADPH2:quinone reductase
MDSGLAGFRPRPGMTSMKAILCKSFGTPDELELADIAPPVAGAGEVVVRIAAAALNFFDTLIIAGKYQAKPPFPFSPAAEFAGTVESIGADVSGIAAGERVMGYAGWGAARERIAVNADNVVKLPAGLDFERAAGLTVTYATTLYALRERAQLQAGETLVVLGAAGGTGLAAIELGKVMGARVIAQAKFRSCRSTSCCSRAATSAACSGAHGPSASRRSSAR